MKFPRESKSKFIYDDCFSTTQFQNLKKTRLMFSSFNPFVPSLPKQNSLSVATVFSNKTRPLFVGIRYREAFFSFLK